MALEADNFSTLAPGSHSAPQETTAHTKTLTNKLPQQDKLDNFHSA